MTSQTKVFIELSDITALRLECKRCKATLSLALSNEIDVKKLRVCPNCSNPWTMLPEGNTIELTVKGAIDSLKTLAASIVRDAFPLGCSLTLEVKDVAPVTRLGQ